MVFISGIVIRQKTNMQFYVRITWEEDFIILYDD